MFARFFGLLSLGLGILMSGCGTDRCTPALVADYESAFITHDTRATQCTRARDFKSRYQGTVCRAATGDIIKNSQVIDVNSVAGSALAGCP